MFWDTIQELCAKRSTKPTTVVKELGLSTSMPTQWKAGRIPNGSTLQKLADYFGVSVDYLLGNAEKEKPSEEGSGGEDVVVVNRSGKRFVHHLSPEQLDILNGMIEQMEKNNQ